MLLSRSFFDSLANNLDWGSFVKIFPLSSLCGVSICHNVLDHIQRAEAAGTFFRKLTFAFSRHYPFLKIDFI